MFKAYSFSPGSYNSRHDNPARLSRIHCSKIDRADFPDPPMEVFDLRNKFAETVPMTTCVFVAMEILLLISSSSAPAVRSLGSIVISVSNRCQMAGKPQRGDLPINQH